MDGAAGKTIVIVDDEWIIRMTVAGDLGDLGYSCREAGDGAEGLALLRDRPETALLITDLALPGGLDGQALAAQARAERPNLKVLFITGNEDRAEALGQTDAVLVKPFTMAQMSAQVARLLGSEPQ
jgi:CheY-like chemotaxis protein